MPKLLTTAFSTAALTAGLLLGAPAAGAQAAAYPTSSFDVTYGNTYTRGTITWYNRQVVVSGEHKSVSATSCRGTTAFGVDSQNHDVAVNFSDHGVCGASAKFSFPVTFYQAGVGVVRICLDNGAEHPPVAYLKCARYGRP
ncbi:hypothetical protein OHV05_34650 [Kitasatospora sp. NBC_00070]|uniref:hypothetical protein n=1 Tax=Kitasatospora sp. NBC_00070 TaxID=2975962 RepID=UPI00324A5A66